MVTALGFAIPVVVIFSYLFGYDHGKKMAFRLLRGHIGKRDLERAIAYEEAVHHGREPRE